MSLHLSSFTQVCHFLLGSVSYCCVLPHVGAGSIYPILLDLIVDRGLIVMTSSFFMVEMCAIIIFNVRVVAPVCFTSIGMVVITTFGEYLLRSCFY